MAPWRASALKHGYLSSIALPLKDENKKVFGVFQIYSRKANAVTRDEIRLLDELTNDMAFGIISLRNRKQRKHAEETLRQNEERYRLLYENSPLGIYRTTPGGKILLANSALLQMLGYSSFEEIEKRNLGESGFEPLYERKQFINQIETNGEVIGLESPGPVMTDQLFM